MSQSFTAGEAVRYVPTHAAGDLEHKDCEDGVVSETVCMARDKVFVKFPGSPDAKACYVWNLYAIGG